MRTRGRRGGLREPFGLELDEVFVRLGEHVFDEEPVQVRRKRVAVPVCGTDRRVRVVELVVEAGYEPVGKCDWDLRQ